MVTYVINRTDSNKASVNVEEKTVNVNFPIALFGRQKLKYGEQMNENILHLLENFACPEDSGSPGNPDLSVALDNTLQNAIDGQLWFNSTDELIYVRSNGEWVALSLFGEVAANFGTISHGQQLPLPVSNSGYVFTYDECAWIVAPYTYPDEIEFMRCFSDTNDSTVTMQYSVLGDPTLINGQANYMIVGIRDNNNIGLNYIDP